jgi:NADPH:quinone reductase-like Zn-dependent oxidoreductase
VLVIGAAGGVGAFAVQLAKAFGAQVTGVCSTAKTELVRSIGADHVIDYKHDDFADGARQFDLIVDTAGNRPVSVLRRALKPKGTLAIVGGEGGGRLAGGIGRSLGAALLSVFVGQRLTGVMSTERAEDLRFLTGLIEAGAVTPVIGKCYALADAPAAIRDLRDGHLLGKAVVTV